MLRGRGKPKLHGVAPEAPPARSVWEHRGVSLENEMTSASRGRTVSNPESDRLSAPLQGPGNPSWESDPELSCINSSALGKRLFFLVVGATFSGFQGLLMAQCPGITTGRAWGTV